MEDKNMQLEDKLTIEKETVIELRSEIKELNLRIKELEDDLKNRPDAKDDSSSSSEEKEDWQAKYEDYKFKFESAQANYKQVTDDYKEYKRKSSSEIEELQISLTNLEKRNVELLVLLRKHKIEVDSSITGEVKTTTTVVNTEIKKEIK